MTSSKNSNNISQKTFLQIHSLIEFDNLVGTSVYNKAVADIENINEPRYYPQQIIKLIPEITSRKLNDWDAKGLLVKHRESSSGWRLFSLADVVRLRIIQDLKTYGMSNIQIQKALTDIFELNDMSFAEIREIAMKLGLESTNVEKEHLIYNIINKLESGYEEKLEEGNEEKKEEVPEVENKPKGRPGRKKKIATTNSDTLDENKDIRSGRAHV